MNLINSSITLRALEISVFLGWPKEERAEKQTVSVDVHITFLNAPAGCVTDKLEDTQCYADLVNVLQEKVVAQKFHLLEHLGFELYQTVKRLFSNETKISLRVLKHPPIPHLTGGVAFYYGDEVNTW